MKKLINYKKARLNPDLEVYQDGTKIAGLVVNPRGGLKPRPRSRQDPDQSIKQFRDKHFTQGLAMVVSWGEMSRRPNVFPKKLEGVGQNNCSDSREYLEIRQKLTFAGPFRSHIARASSGVAISKESSSRIRLILLTCSALLVASFPLPA